MLQTQCNLTTYQCIFIIVGIATGTDTVTTVATKHLQQRYSSSRFSSSVDEWPPHKPKHYTTLAFIHNKGKFTDAVRFFVAQELAVAGNINATQLCSHSNLNANMTKNISDIFLPVRASGVSFVDLHILIEGVPGIGKTVLAKEIAYRWAENELLTSKKLLFLVFLRECFQKTMISIEDLIQFVFKNSEMTSCLTKYLTKTDGKDTVIIFDGFDELSEENREGSVIIDIINRRILTKCCLVITSRPTASSILHDSVDRRVEIVGFTEEDRLDYIQTALANHDKKMNVEQVSNEHVKALQNYLQSNPTINALCYIPFNMTILRCLVEDGIDKLPKTQTEIYKKFIEMTILRFIKKYDKSNTIINIDELLDPYDKLFVELTKLAYKALKTDKIIFTLPEIKKGCPNLTMTSSNWNGLGLLKAVQCFSIQMGNDQVTFHFLHFSIQEYMAAWYISTLPDRKQIKLLQNTFWEHRYYNTWIMYVGITGGSSSALKYFLSGNWFQLYSKLFTSSKVSKKFLKHKMKCLHLFQCLLEVNKEDIIKSVKQLFENNRIDLSNQTLLPSDLNTLGFFLIRSVNKQWDELDLSNCNIGNNGSNVLCDRLLDKDARGIVTIKVVKFSYNQLNFASLIRLFGLFKYWHTSEIIITDYVTHDVRAIEDTIFQSSNTLVLVLIGPCLFCKNTKSSRILDVLSNTTNIRSIYLLNCIWTSNDSETIELLTMLEEQKLNRVRIIGSFLNVVFIITLVLRLSDNNNSANMFVYDPTMSDQIADDISSSILSSYKNISGVVLIVSSSKVQGIVNTCSLTNELSALEIFNLSIYIRYLSTKMCPWREHLGCKVYDYELIFSFIKLLYKTNFNWKLRITLWENDTLIIHKTEFESLDKSFYLTSNISAVYISSSGINKLEYDAINKKCSTLHILNSPECVKLLHAKLLHKQSVPNKLFIYGNIKYNLMNCLIELLSHDHPNISVVLAANGVIVGIQPKSELIALAIQLQPSPTTWILSTTDNASIFYQVINALNVLLIEWTELDFTGCNIGDVECDIMYRAFRCKNCSTVRKLSMSLSRLSISGMHNLVNIVLMCGVMKLNVMYNGTNDALLDSLINNLKFKHQNYFFLSITYNHKVFQIICNQNWNKIGTNLDVQASELHIINCKLQWCSTEIITYMHMAHKLLKLCIISCSISKTIIAEIIQTFLNKNIEVSISDVRIIDDDTMIRRLLTSREFYLDIKLNFVLSTDQWLCVYNITKCQLHLIQKYFMNQPQPYYYTMTKLEQTDGDRLVIFENKLVNVIRVCGKALQGAYATEIMGALSNSTSLNIIDIKNYHITNEDADNLATILHRNPHLQELHLVGNRLETDNAIKIIKALQVVVTLTKFSLCNNDITAEVGDDIAVMISHNIHLQELNLGSNDFQESGVIKLAKSLQKISSLTKLYISHSKTTCQVAGHLAAAISHNVRLQDLDISVNDLQTIGSIHIALALQGTGTLTRVCLNNNNICYKAANDIAVAIAKNVHLQELNISGNSLGAAGAKMIAKGLQEIVTLKKLYINNNNITDEAADEIAAVIHCNSKLEELDVSENDLKTEGIIKIAVALQSIVTLTKLNISNNNITYTAANAIAVAISHNTHLQEFLISGNYLSVMGATTIARSLQRLSTLTKLYIANTNISDEAADDITAAVSCNIHLQEFDISRNNFQELGAARIARGLQRISTLTKLYMNKNIITYEAANNIAAVISRNTQLEVLNVSGNNLQEMGVIEIAKSLQHIYTLKKLSLNNNNITDKAAGDIAAAISCNTQLEELDVSGNNLQEMGVVEIAKSLQHIYTLKKLSLNNNNITYKAAGHLAAAISHNVRLQDLDISVNDLQTIGSIHIALALQGTGTLTRVCLNNNNICYKAANDIAVAIAKNVHLQELNISGNSLGAAGAKMIAKGLQEIVTLKKLYINNNNITDEAADEIAAVIHCNSKLEELDVSENDLRTEGIIKIAVALQSIVTLTKLNISNNNITCTAANAIAVAISHNTHLQEFLISGNYLSVMGATTIARSLQRLSTLTKLYIANINISDEAADDIAAAVSCNIHLQEFDISRNNFQELGAARIARGLQKVSTLTKLYMNKNIITYEAANNIAAVISRNTQLEVLNVSGNNLQEMGVIEIAKSLQHIYTLKKLSLNNNNITDKAAGDIAAAISCNTQLEELDVSGNNLQEMGVVEIAKSLQHIYTLKKLSLNNNNITDKAADAIAAVISCKTKLEKLYLSGNDLRTGGFIKIAIALQSIVTLTKLNISNNNITCTAANAIAIAISHNTHLQEFLISGNYLSVMGATTIARSLQKLSTLKKLYIANTNISDEAADDIAAAVSCNIHLQEFDISRNNLQALGAARIP